LKTRNGAIMGSRQNMTGQAGQKHHISAQAMADATAKHSETNILKAYD